MKKIVLAYYYLATILFIFAGGYMLIYGTFWHMYEQQWTNAGIAFVFAFLYGYLIRIGIKEIKEHK